LTELRGKVVRFLNSFGWNIAVLVFCAFVVGWFMHRSYGRYVDRHDDAARECRDEVVSVDNAHGAVSCSQASMTSELKDGYLVCKCKRK